MDAAAAGELMARRRIEDERFAYFAEASIVFLDLPDAVFRGYEGDDQLLGAPRDDDAAPFELLAPGDRPARAAEGLPPARRRRPRRPPALPRGRRPAAPGGPPLGDAGAGLRRDRRRSTRTSRTPGGTTSAARGPRRRTPLAGLPADVSHRRRVRRHHRPARAQDHGHQPLRRASSSGCSTARARWPTPSASYGRAIAELGDVDGSAERYWVSGRV